MIGFWNQDKNKTNLPVRTTSNRVRQKIRNHIFLKRIKLRIIVACLKYNQSFGRLTNLFVSLLTQLSLSLSFVRYRVHAFNRVSERASLHHLCRLWNNSFTIAHTHTPRSSFFSLSLFLSVTVEWQYVKAVKHTHMHIHIHLKFYHYLDLFPPSLSLSSMQIISCTLKKKRCYYCCYCVCLCVFIH